MTATNTTPAIRVHPVQRGNTAARTTAKPKQMPATTMIAPWTTNHVSSRWVSAAQSSTFSTSE